MGREKVRERVLGRGKGRGDIRFGRMRKAW